MLKISMVLLSHDMGAYAASLFGSRICEILKVRLKQNAFLIFHVPIIETSANIHKIFRFLTHHLIKSASLSSEKPKTIIYMSALYSQLFLHRAQQVKSLKRSHIVEVGLVKFLLQRRKKRIFKLEER